MWNNLNTEEDLITGILNHGPDVIKYAQSSADISQYLLRLSQEHLKYPIPADKIDPTEWFIPNEYKNLDIKSHLISICPSENKTRLLEELALFQKNDMMPVLNCMKYIVDTLRQNGIVWGVGRGSSVASYTLFLLGVHKIDSVKYSLPIEEFFKGDING